MGLRLLPWALICGLFTIALSTAPVKAQSDWEQSLEALIAADDAARQEELLEEVLAAEPFWWEVALLIEEQEYAAPTETGFNLRHSMCTDEVERPWALYVPPDYDGSTPTPLFVVLHGGVSTPEIPEEPLPWAEESVLMQLAVERGWLAVFPYGQDGATWWDEVGMANINNIVCTVKREFNVNDDRVYMGGYSDGASGSFCWAMIDPTDYAAFAALSGHLGVGSLDGELPTYAPNLANTAIYAVTSFEDQLYASDQMRPSIEMALDVGADIFYREQEGLHDFSYAGEELPLLGKFFGRHARDPFPQHIVWETATSQYGRCRWLAIDAITGEQAAPWHQDHNAILADSSIIIGFVPDHTYEGEGMAVGEVMEDTFAEDTGLLAGDIVVRCNETPIVSGDDLWEWKSTVSRGDAIELEVLREGQSVVLSGNLPPVLNYYIFARELPSACVRARFMGNRVDIEASRVGALRLLIHPEMFRLERPIMITVNGAEVFNGTVEADLEYMLRNYLQHRDRSLLYVAELPIEL